MPHILRLRNDGSVANTGWFKIGTKYTPTDIQSIQDPAGANTGVLLTSIPSPFARMHLLKPLLIWSIPQTTMGFPMV